MLPASNHQAFKHHHHQASSSPSIHLIISIKPSGKTPKTFSHLSSHALLLPSNFFHQRYAPPHFSHLFCKPETKEEVMHYKGA
jgi:hypothetical protein